MLGARPSVVIRTSQWNDLLAAAIKSAARYATPTLSRICIQHRTQSSRVPLPLNVIRDRYIGPWRAPTHLLEASMQKYVLILIPSAAMLAGSALAAI